MKIAKICQSQNVDFLSFAFAIIFNFEHRNCTLHSSPYFLFSSVKFVQQYNSPNVSMFISNGLFLDLEFFHCKGGILFCANSMQLLS